jgi:hypothetical protein
MPAHFFKPQNKTKMKLSERIQNHINAVQIEHNKNSDYRMQNYYNCVDDYSWGGICDRAQDHEMMRLKGMLYNVLEQEENGGFCKEIAHVYELQDMDGNVLSTRLVKGKFGLCFIIQHSEHNVSFVGATKNQSTFAKKGFKVITKTYELKVVYTGTLNSKFANRSVELISLSETMQDKVDYNTGADTSLWLFQQNN